MTDQDTPLSSLCSICYTNPPKYVCPRDHVKTCSLPCYKRHQQRASCNGKRDPTAYVKKENLTTASGIDHDYNFLSGVEHVFDKADREREVRGIGQADQSLRKRWHPDGPLQRYLRHNQILVDRAPLGMSRQKANQTRYIQKSKKIVWTIEWIDVDGSKRLSEAHEAATIGDAYAAMLADRDRESKKRKRAASPEASSKSPNTNRDIAQTQTISESLESEDQPQPKATTSDAENADGIASTPHSDPAPLQQATADESPSTRTPTLHEPHASQPVEPQPGQPDGSQDPPEPDNDNTRSLILSRIQSEQSRQAALRTSKLPTGPPFFYLVRPHTTSTARVLVPLHSDQSLSSSLELRTVLEFPTIHVLNQAQDELPETFMTEEAYLKNKREEDREVEELLKAVPGSAAAGRIGAFGERAAVERPEGDDLDPSKILEMLQRDVPT